VIAGNAIAVPLAALRHGAGNCTARTGDISRVQPDGSTIAIAKEAIASGIRTKA
jgi:hypothetical protein